MTNEAVKVELTNETGFPRRYTCASGVAISKGTVLALSHPRTAAASIAADDPCAGIAAMDKEANDYSTSITAWTDGIFEMYASGAISAGDPVSTDAAEYNYIHSALTYASGARIIGYAMETAADGDVINVRVRL